MVHGLGRLYHCLLITKLSFRSGFPYPFGTLYQTTCFHGCLKFSNCIVHYINNKQNFVFLITLQHIMAIINCDLLVLMDSDHPAIQEFIPELEVRCHGSLSHSYVSHPSTPQSSLPSFLPPPSPFTLPFSLSLHRSLPLPGEAEIIH